MWNWHSCNTERVDISVPERWASRYLARAAFSKHKSHRLLSLPLICSRSIIHALDATRADMTRHVPCHATLGKAAPFRPDCNPTARHPLLHCPLPCCPPFHLPDLRSSGPSRRSTRWEGTRAFQSRRALTRGLLSASIIKRERWHKYARLLRTTYKSLRMHMRLLYYFDLPFVPRPAAGAEPNRWCVTSHLSSQIPGLPNT
jgi:hypothetical protein